MALVNTVELLKEAEKNKVAIASFNIHNLETIHAAIKGAEEENCPVIIQTTPGTLKHAGIEYICAIVKEASEHYKIPIALHLDHCKDFDMIMKCIRYGYSSVMIDTAHLSYEENIKMVKKVVEAAHGAGVSVEGELGRIGGVEDGLSVNEREAFFTVPSEAKDFVEKTGLDFLAIAIGTAHGKYKGEPKLDFERLSEIRKAVNVPLVLHGASGVPEVQIKESIKRGISKINIATELKIPMADAIKKCFKENPEEIDPRNYMGAAIEAVKAVVKEKIEICGGRNFADRSKL